MFFFCLSACVLLGLAPVLGAPTPSNFLPFTLKCLDGSIEVDVQTNEDFKGVIYTQGSFRHDGCHLDAKGGTTFQLKFALNNCKTVDNGKGVYTNVIIVQNEDELVTLEDSSFEVKCDYNLKTTIRLAAQRPIQIEASQTTPGAGRRSAVQQAVASIAKNSIYLSNDPIRNATLLTNGSNVAIIG